MTSHVTSRVKLTCDVARVLSRVTSRGQIMPAIFCGKNFYLLSLEGIRIAKFSGKIYPRDVTRDVTREISRHVDNVDLIGKFHVTSHVNLAGKFPC